MTMGCVIARGVEDGVLPWCRPRASRPRAVVRVSCPGSVAPSFFHCPCLVQGVSRSRHFASDFHSLHPCASPRDCPLNDSCSCSCPHCWQGRPFATGFPLPQRLILKLFFASTPQRRRLTSERSVLPDCAKANVLVVHNGCGKKRPEAGEWKARAYG